MKLNNTPNYSECTYNLYECINDKDAFRISVHKKFTWESKNGLKNYSLNTINVKWFKGKGIPTRIEKKLHEFTFKWKLKEWKKEQQLLTKNALNLDVQF